MDNPELIIFDLDGTLVNAYPAITSSFNHTMQRLGYPVQSPEIVRRAVGGGDRNLLLPFVRKSHLDCALAIYRRHHAGALKKLAVLMPGAGKILREMKQHNLKLAIASNRPRRFSLILLENLGIRRLFDAVVCKDMVRFGKPHPLMLNTIMRLLHVAPHKTVYVGDMIVDIEAGKRAHVFTVAVTTGSNSAQELRASHPDILLATVADLPRILSGL
jgi:HAD superfamily hydrolase (TIGR01509 family)